MHKNIILSVAVTFVVIQTVKSLEIAPSDIKTFLQGVQALSKKTSNLYKYASEY